MALYNKDSGESLIEFHSLVQQLGIQGCDGRTDEMIPIHPNFSKQYNKETHLNLCRFFLHGIYE